ncbi:MAG: DUF5131 family protein [Erysipelotrichaceae bacterium]|nr:DUF5131 family protein [Erysipelotrichaceae bacterium]
MPVWNPWHGCHKKSAGCLHCYVYRRDSMYDKDSNIVTRTNDFNLGIRRHRDGSYYLRPGSTVYCCMTSDFFIEEADQWRKDIWDMIRYRSDLNIHIITKRIERFIDCIPEDWKDGWDHVTIISTIENQAMADERMPIFLSLPIKHKAVNQEPMLGPIDMDKYLKNGQIEWIGCGGESGDDARVCDYSWILDTRRQCIANNVSFHFHQTGANFRKDGKTYKIPRERQHSQAKKANINYERK